MDFSLGEDRQMLVDSLRRLFSETFDFKQRESVVASDEGWSPALWKQLADLGIIGALFEEEYGGYGGSAFDIGVVFGEVGHALAIGPFLGTLLAGRILGALGRSDLVAQAVTSEVVLTAALDGPEYLSARPVGEGWVLSGRRSVVPFVGQADIVVTVANTDEGAAIFILNDFKTGVRAEEYPLVDGGMAGELFLDGAPATLCATGASATDVMEKATAAGLVALAWEAVAILDTLRDQTLDYLRTRKQFGIPIGKFQALQHRMAALALEIEQARSAAINAAARFDADRCSRERAGSAAKFTIGRVGSLVAEEVIQMHGGIGMTWELPLSHFAKRLILIGHQLGDEDYHLKRFVDLGRPSAEPSVAYC